MKLRPLLLSVAVLAPLAAAVWWFQRPQPAPSASDARVGARLADPAALADAARVRVSSAGKSVELVRAEGGRWTVAGEPALPADASRLTRLSADLVAAKVERFVTANKDRLAALDLGSAAVDFLAADGKPLLELDLGKNADGGGRFARFGAEERAYLANLSAWIDAEPASWRDTALAPSLQAADIASLRIVFPDTGKTVVLSREKADGEWSSPDVPAGHRVKASVATTQIGNLATLRYTAVAPNLDPGVVAARVFPREIGLTTFDGRAVRIVFARTPPPPAPPAPKEGETAPPAPAEQPRPVYVEVTDTKGDAVLAAAAKTHAFEVAEWVFTGLPAKAEDLFEPAPVPPAAGSAEPAKQPAGPISVTTEPLTVPAAP